MVPVSVITTSLFWIAKAGEYFSVQPLPNSVLSGRSKVSTNRPLGSSTEKYWALDLPPALASGVNTVTSAVEAVVRSEAGTVAVSWVAETNFVGRSAPFQRTTEPVPGTNPSDTNPTPVTVSVTSDAPATADTGVSPVVMAVGSLPAPRLVRAKLSYE